MILILSSGFTPGKSDISISTFKKLVTVDLYTAKYVVIIIMQIIYSLAFHMLSNNVHDQRASKASSGVKNRDKAY